MNAPTWCTRLAAALVATAAVAQLASCSQTAVSVSGHLDRPSGLAYVARTSSTTDCAPAAGETSCSGQYRSTLFVADSEAQGVRVVNLYRDYTIQFSATTGAIIKKTFNDTQRYVLAPVVFFPLVIPASGFPTELALSADGNRLYVLAAATKTLHVLDVHEPMTATTDSYRPISEIALDAIGTSTSTPVALALLGSNGTTDYVAVALDGGATGSVLAGLTIAVNGTEAQLTATSTVPIHGAPRSLLVRGDVVIASSAQPAPCRATPAECTSLPPSYELSLVRADRTNGPLALRPAQPLSPVEVGGPTSKLVDYGAQGFFAVRDDRASLVFVQAMNDAYQRYPDFLPSPFTPEAERGTPATVGRLDVRESPVGAAAWGSLPGGEVDPLLTNRTPFSIFRDTSGATPYDVALLVHLDARAAFVTGSPPELRLQDDSPVVSVFDESAPAEAGKLRLGTANRGFCEAPPQLCGEAVVAPSCTADIVGTDADRIDPQVLRATYQGNLIRSRSGGVLALLAGAGPGVSLELRDPTLANFTGYQVRAGDAVRLQVALRAACAASDPSEVSHAADPLTVLTATVASLREVAGEPPVLVLSPITTDLFAGCAAGDVPAVALRYEVHPATSEVVVARAAGLGVARVFERVATSSRSVTLGDTADPTARHKPPLNVRLVASGGFTCADEVQPGAECVTDDDCGGSGTCVASTGSCYGRCSTSCTLPSCAAPEAVRRCTGVRFGIGQSITATVDLNGSSGLTALPAPSNAVFSPLRRSWFVSFPGAREVAELFSQSFDATDPANASPLDVRHVIR